MSEVSTMKPALTAAESRSSPTDEFDGNEETKANERNAAKAVDSATITGTEILLVKHTSIAENTSKNVLNDIEVENLGNVVNLKKESTIEDHVQTLLKVNTDKSLKKSPLLTVEKKKQNFELSSDEEFIGFEQMPIGKNLAYLDRAIKHLAEEIGNQEKGPSGSSTKTDQSKGLPNLKLEPLNPTKSVRSKSSKVTLAQQSFLPSEGTPKGGSLVNNAVSSTAPFAQPASGNSVPSYAENLPSTSYGSSSKHVNGVGSSEILKPVKKVANRPFPLDDPIYKKPFKYGWKRELVYRAIPEASKEKGEVYYITPQGKKLRTKHEIGAYLHDDLTLNNFIFSKEPIGGASEEEIIRSAKSYGNTPKRTGMVVVPEQTDLARQNKPQKRPGTPQSISPVKRTIKTSSGRLSTFSSAHQTPPSTPFGHSSKSSGVKSLVTETVMQNRQGSPVPTPANRAKTEACSIQCLLAMGIIPQLQCKICLNLYHDICVGIHKSDTNLDYYICKYCQINIAAEGIRDTKSNKTKDSPNSTMKSSGLNKDAPSGSTSTKISPKKVTFQIPSENSSTGNDPEEAILPQGVAVLSGKKYIVIPKVFLDCTASCVGVNSTTLPAPQLLKNKDNQGISLNNPANSKHGNNSSTTANTAPVSILKRDKPSNSGDSSKNMVVSNCPPSNSNFTTNFFGNVAAGYTILLKTFRYLKVKELLRAGSVCKMWNEVANHTILWRTVRMKNSLVIDWSGLVQTLNKNSTKTLDLRKMLIIPDKAEEMWENYSQNISVLTNLERIDLCRCPAIAVENLLETNINLKFLNALHIQSKNIDLTCLSNLTELEELRLRSLEGMEALEDKIPFSPLTKLRHLAITTVNKIDASSLLGIVHLVELESLELGQCIGMTNSFAIDVLPCLVKLERLRLEKAPESCNLALTRAISQMPKLTQLELINCDIKPGFDLCLGQCTNIRRLLLIPTYVAQSAATNNMILSGVFRLRRTLKTFVWGFTTELLRVTDLYVDRCDIAGKSVAPENIPILKPVPGVEEDDGIAASRLSTTIPQVEIVPLTSVQIILGRSLPHTKIKILKTSYAATWKQNLSVSRNH